MKLIIDDSNFKEFSLKNMYIFMANKDIAEKYADFEKFEISQLKNYMIISMYLETDTDTDNLANILKFNEVKNIRIKLNDNKEIMMYFDKLVYITKSYIPGESTLSFTIFNVKEDTK